MAIDLFCTFEFDAKPAKNFSMTGFDFIQYEVFCSISDIFYWSVRGNLTSVGTVN
jgi:hypothetical protein